MPSARARTHTAAAPDASPATIWAVTSRGHDDTPDATTPWSAANTTTVAGPGGGGGQTPAIAASWTDRSSSWPSDPVGLVSCAWRAEAAAAARSSSGPTDARASSHDRPASASNHAATASPTVPPPTSV